AVAGSPERHDAERPRGRNAARGVREELAGRDRGHGNAEPLLKADGHALAGVDGTARAGEDERPRAVAAARGLERAPHEVAVADHPRRRLQPGPRLLADLAERVPVALRELLVPRGLEEAADRARPAQAAEPLVEPLFNRMTWLGK